ncbi:MAG: HAD-IIA family hydrolase [Anaerolineae bacterium]|nr:HAD-IIA family hydrolase [Anaerolineae bacterium]
MQTHNSLDELKKIRGLIIDMDGVLWHGDNPAPGLVRFFEVLREKQIRFVLATNNNTQTLQGFVDKAARLGVEIKLDEVVNATVATVDYLKANYVPGSRIYVVGEAPLKMLISQAGFELADKDVKAVVATMDRGLTYEMLKTATLLIRSGADFIGTNPDRSYPTAEGIVPGAGAVLASLAVSTDKVPLIMGKPEKPIFEISLKRMGLQANEVASLGDRLDTDIEGGIRCGLKSILVLSGVTSLADAESSSIKPNWIFTNIEELASYL